MIVALTTYWTDVDGETIEVPAMQTNGCGCCSCYIPTVEVDDKELTSLSIIDELKDNEQRLRQFLDAMNISYTIEIDWP